MVARRANPTPTVPRIRYFQAASMAAGVLVIPTSRADTTVVASIATHSRPRLSRSGTVRRLVTNHRNRA
jgi:hypothetical protein